MMIAATAYDDDHDDDVDYDRYPHDAYNDDHHEDHEMVIMFR